MIGVVLASVFEGELVEVRYLDLFGIHTGAFRHHFVRAHRDVAIGEAFEIVEEDPK